MRTTLLVMGLSGGLAACTTVQRIGPPHLPQLEQASQAVQGPADRLNAHNACASASRGIDDMIDCMARAGYAYVERQPHYPEDECWKLRDDRGYGGGRLPETFCFVKAPPKPGETEGR